MTAPAVTAPAAPATAAPGAATRARPAASRAGSGRPGPSRETAVLAGGLVVGLVVWALALPAVDPFAAGGWGLAQVLPAATWVGIVLVVGAWVLGIMRDHGGRVLRVTGLLTTIVVLYGLQPATEPLPRTTTVWLHLGFVQRFVETGQTAQGLDARFSWPGMFAGWGLLESSGHAASLVAIASWHPVAIAVLLAGLTLAVVRRLGADTRRAWLAVALVMVTDWIEQDYFSPQGQLHLVSLLLLALAIPVRGRRTSPVTYLLIVALTAALVVSHQLSPALLLVQLVVLAVAERRAVGRWGLPAAVALVLAAAELAWLSIGAREFWTGQLALFLDGFGQVGSTMSKNLGDRLAQGDPGLMAIRGLRMAMAASLLVAAFAGAMLARRRGRPWVLVPTLAIVPWLVVPLQSYGGELFMRCLLFGLPFLALATAELLVPADATPDRAARPRLRTLAASTPHPIAPEHVVRPAGPWRAVLAVFVIVSSACALVVARGGNDGFYVYAPSELRMSQLALEDTPAGGLLFMPLEQGPVRTERIGQIRIGRAADLCPDVADAVECVAREMPDRILVTASMQRAKTLAEGDSPTWSAEFLSRTQALGYRVLATDEGSTVLAREVGHTPVTNPAGPIQIPLTRGGIAELVLLGLGLVAVGVALADRRGRRRLWLLAAVFPLGMAAVLVAQVARVAMS